MTSKDLFRLTLKDLRIDNLHPLHKAMIEECCEKVVEDQQNISDTETLLHAVRLAFIVSNSMFKSMTNALLTQADIINLNYRGINFTIDANSPLLRG